MQKNGFKIDFKEDSDFWVTLTGTSDKGKPEYTGKVRIQVDVLPKDYADMNKVGEARQEPNINPFLPPPTGRISLTLNPLKMFVSSIFSCFSNKWSAQSSERKYTGTAVSLSASCF